LKEENYKEKVNIDRCQQCGGVWLDAGELEMLVEREHGFISGFLKHLLD
jgi:Zn-finger nucleic acid-binding protein